MVLQTFGSHDWVENFRMKKETFQYLRNQLRPSIERRDTQLRSAISVEHRVAITLWCLATPVEYRTIAHLFGVARSTVCEIVHETAQSIVSVLLKHYLYFPTGAQLDDVIRGFESKWGFPQCAGAIDGSHIPVRAPTLNHTDYYNRKGWYSIIIQAVVDHNYIFRDVCIGRPGSVHDARVLANSTLYEKATSQKILNGHVKQMMGHDIPAVLVGDSGYLLLTWIMKPYAHNTCLTRAQKSYNYRLSRARIVVENAFGRLKARWRRLLKPNDMLIENVPNLVAACCVLHNICEIHGEAFDNDWLEEALAAQQQQPNIATHDEDTLSAPDIIRETLVQYFST